MTDPRLEALRRAVAQAPGDAALRLVLAQVLSDAGEPGEAVEHFHQLGTRGALGAADALRAAELALQIGQLDWAGDLVVAARASGAVEGVESLLKAIEAARTVSNHGRERELGAPEPVSGARWSPEEKAVSFSDVGGLEAVKKVVNRMVVLPLHRPDLYERYGRRAGGGVLLYGPPGCGKTLLARATAGECGLPFFNARLEEVLDPYIGVSERNLSSLFSAARELSPCVLFIDEIDGLGYARRRRQTETGRGLVDVLLQQLDELGSERLPILVLGATNAPWDVDDALLRPGRFDRTIFVPPPDAVARRRIIELLLADVTYGDIEAGRLAERTELFSGADLRAVVERAVDVVIDEALESGGQPPLGQRHLDAALGETRSTTIDWLERARNYIEFANHDGRYEDVAGYLHQRSIARLLRRHRDQH
jgi:AAA+ superfamily predicted ATPase